VAPTSDGDARRVPLFGSLCALVFLVNFGRVVFAPLVAPLQAFFTASDAAVGLVVLLGFQSYLFGLTVWLAGTRPKEFLFDTLLFSVFFLAVAIPMIPVLVVAVALPEPSLLVLGTVLAGACLLALAGRLLLSTAGSRWEHRLRTE